MKTMPEQNTEGVSAVIGIILMVAITVILAAAIAAFVFGLVENAHKSYIVGATAQRVDPHTVIVTYNGGADSEHVTEFILTSSESGPGVTVDTLGTTIGSTATITGINEKYPDDLILTAKYDDGSSAVVMTSSV